MKNRKRSIAALLTTGALLALFAAGCGQKDAQVVIYSNADEEAVTAMKNALDNNGYEGKYIFQTFGTSELGGKLIAEGRDIEADMVTMSSFYLDSAQEQNQMFKTLEFSVPALDTYPDFYSPITKQEGAIFYNTEMMKENNLPIPASIADLADPVYQDMVSVTDIKSSSTAWLLMQALVGAYGEDGAEETLRGIYQNAGDHIESSGSAPLKKVRAGEVALGFGLRHQAVRDQQEGLPVAYVDPAEGTYSLTESVAVIDKGEDSNPLAMEMAECIIKNARTELQQTYPLPIYEGEPSDAANTAPDPKVFPEPLTVELLEQHQAISEAAKQ